MKKGKNEINKYELYTPKKIANALIIPFVLTKRSRLKNDFLLKAFEPRAILTEGTWHENV